MVTGSPPLEGSMVMVTPLPWFTALVTLCSILNLNPCKPPQPAQLAVIVCPAAWIAAARSAM